MVNLRLALSRSTGGGWWKLRADFGDQHSGVAYERRFLTLEDFPENIGLARTEQGTALGIQGT